MIDSPFSFFPARTFADRLRLRDRCITYTRVKILRQSLDNKNSQLFVGHISSIISETSTGWWLNQPIWKICSSNWKSSPSRGEIKQTIETTNQSRLTWTFECKGLAVGFAKHWKCVSVTFDESFFIKHEMSKRDCIIFGMRKEGGIPCISRWVRDHSYTAMCCLCWKFAEPFLPSSPEFDLSRTELEWKKSKCQRLSHSWPPTMLANCWKWRLIGIPIFPGQTIIIGFLVDTVHSWEGDHPRESTAVELVYIMHKLCTPATNQRIAVFAKEQAMFPGRYQCICVCTGHILPRSVWTQEAQMVAKV